MDPDASRLQNEVVDARERVGQDVGELADRANVVHRATHAVSDRIDGVKHAAGSVKDAVTGSIDSVRGAVGGSIAGAQDAVGGTLQNVKSSAGALGNNPLGMMLAGLAVGLLAGLLLPLTRVEEDKLRPLAEDVRDRLVDAGQDAIARGQTVIKETFDAGKQAAMTSVQEQTRLLGDDLRQGTAGGGFAAT